MILSEYYKKNLQHAHDDVIERGKELLTSINSIVLLEPVFLDETNYVRYESYKRTLVNRTEVFHQRLNAYMKALWYEVACRDFAMYDSREEHLGVVPKK